MSNLEGLSVAWSPTPSRAAGENLAPQWRQRPSCWDPPPQGVPGFLCCHRLFDTGPSGCPSPLSHVPAMALQFFLLFKIHPPQAISHCEVPWLWVGRPDLIGGESGPELGRASHSLSQEGCCHRWSSMSQEEIEDSRAGLLQPEWLPASKFQFYDSLWVVTVGNTPCPIASASLPTGKMTTVPPHHGVLCITVKT